MHFDENFRKPETEWFLLCKSHRIRLSARTPDVRANSGALHKLALSRSLRGNGGKTNTECNVWFGCSQQVTGGIESRDDLEFVQ